MGRAKRIRRYFNNTCMQGSSKSKNSNYGGYASSKRDDAWKKAMEAVYQAEYFRVLDEQDAYKENAKKYQYYKKRYFKFAEDTADVSMSTLQKKFNARVASRRALARKNAHSMNKVNGKHSKRDYYNYYDKFNIDHPILAGSFSKK